MTAPDSEPVAHGLAGDGSTGSGLAGSGSTGSGLAGSGSTGSGSTGSGSAGGSSAPSLADAVAPLVAAELRSHRGRWVMLIDGGSGSGKTSLAGELAAQLSAWSSPPSQPSQLSELGPLDATPTGTLVRRPQVVSLDDCYPGWDGLAAATHMVVNDLLCPVNPGYRQWDWARDRPGPWVPLAADQHLIVEGCGALTLASAALATITVWLDAPAEIRKHRALARDGDGFAPHWDRWAAQEQKHWTAHRPQDLAHIVVDVTTATAHRQPA